METRNPMFNMSAVCFSVNFNGLALKDPKYFIYNFYRDRNSSYRPSAKIRKLNISVIKKRRRESPNRAAYVNYYEDAYGIKINLQHLRNRLWLTW